VKRFPHPTAGRQLRGLVTAAGAVEIRHTTATFNISATGATATLLNRTAEELLSAEESIEWRARLDRARLARLPYGHLTMTVVAATKPRW
jgi:hypothetical protein